jgi:hypothetical protein
MSKPLDERLRVAKEDLVKIDATIQKSARVVPHVLDEFKRVTAFSSSIDHWIRMLGTRAAARGMLTGLVSQADEMDMVPLGVGRVGFQHARCVGVQAYLATKWAIADRIAMMVGHVLCIRSQLNDPKNPPQLVTHFVREENTKKHTAAMAFYSMKHTFGWPIGISYALRNHFFHDGGELDGTDFFEGPSATSGFAISEVGWKRVEQRAAEYGVDSGHHRVGAGWPTTPRDDLRVVLDVCEREVDDALGILVGSACKALASHVAFIVGEL